MYDPNGRGRFSWGRHSGSPRAWAPSSGAAVAGGVVDARAHQGESGECLAGALPGAEPVCSAGMLLAQSASVDRFGTVGARLRGAQVGGEEAGGAVECGVRLV